MEFVQCDQRLFLNVDQCSTSRRKGKNRGLIKSDIPAPPRQRNQANARERDRTQRTLIPTEPKDRKLSKIETLRLASSYISHLGTQLITGSADQPCLQMFKSSGEEHNFNRSQVCTFCMAGKKISKLCHVDDAYQNINGEHQFYFDPNSESIVLTENLPNYNQTYLI
ncbi:basic helix-loop-helix transcription factor scleraxis-like isoform X3 [Coccinella septempunctata]|uniref:basic helix-loop-helix transcription factor scleraxis-like isoform X3 n=1 Tax=Coccinella septempunctata TaxID=41139 RepID=UPI001D095908|nr:basic helix-loop-helix transcription factor scleraxis-like isoform X3 [Coccinella septempunctata]